MYNIIANVQELLNNRSISVKLTVKFILIATLAVIIGTAIPRPNNVWADSIECPNVTPTPTDLVCNGTKDSDSMLGTPKGDLMYGFEGDDLMLGFATGDQMLGGPGNDHIIAGAGDNFVNGSEGDDNITSESGNDQIIGGRGADEIHGGAGNDVIWHGFQTDSVNELDPDGSKDNIYCGEGEDIVTINISVDGDIAHNDCETVNAG